MTRPKVFVTDWDYPSLDLEQTVMDRADLELVPVQCKTEDDVIAACQEADGLLNQYAPMSRRVLSSLPKLKVLTRYGVGLDRVDVAAATELGIAVCNVPDYGIEEVSDHAIALLMGLARGTHRLDRAIRAGVWDFALVRPVYRMRGKVLGVIGYGRIGQATARKAAGLGLEVIAFDSRMNQPGFDMTGARSVGLEELFSDSDYVSIHAPHTPETNRMINADTLALMKPSAILVNTSRGGLVDTAALESALRNGVIAGAGLDVLETEPIQANHGLLALENCVITPHAAWYSEDAFVELKTKCAEETASVLRGWQPRYCLNPEVLEHVLERLRNKFYRG